ncbi:HepT-like ribonuclease domain-containing protein [Bosea sp. (in: a-proteobacteria)]|uniref:HepT-like ribonuclease domain-containing protein n=1 Tax=Bosea sp. (in: a-proteobacteria) TaxID=1871050 RepID=UPI003F6FCA4B
MWAWADIRAIGNLIRHEYWRIDPDIVWAVITDDLLPLRAAIEDLLASRRA